MSRYGGEKRMSRLKGEAGEPLRRGGWARACGCTQAHRTADEPLIFSELHACAQQSDRASLATEPLPPLSVYDKLRFLHSATTMRFAFSMARCSSARPP